MNEKKKMSPVTIIIIAVVAILVLGLGGFGAVKLVTKVFGGNNNQKTIEKDLAKLGEKYYEEYYYVELGKSFDDRSTILSKYTDIGIKIDLENLGRYNDGEFKSKIDTFKNKKTNKACNQNNTKVVIYPKSPYGKTDYKVETILDCGFEENKDK